MTGFCWAREGATNALLVFADRVDVRIFQKGQMLKKILIDLDLTKCCLQPFHNNVEGDWDLVSPPSATLRYGLIQQFLDSLFCSKDMEGYGSVLSLVSQGKHVCLLTTLKIKVINSLSFVKTGGYLDGKEPGAVEAQQCSWAPEDLPQKGGSGRSRWCKGALVAQTELQDVWSQQFLVALLCL